MRGNLSAVINAPIQATWSQNFDAATSRVDSKLCLRTTARGVYEEFPRSFTSMLHACGRPLIFIQDSRSYKLPTTITKKAFKSPSRSRIPTSMPNRQPNPFLSQAVPMAILAGSYSSLVQILNYKTNGYTTGRRSTYISSLKRFPCRNEKDLQWVSSLQE